MQTATVGAVAQVLEELAPPAWAESWDNVGLQVGAPGSPAGRVLVALELTDDTLAEAKQAGAELVVVHHPAIFTPLRSLRFDTAAGRRLQELIRSGISLYAAHTNLDQAAGGTNDTLAAMVGLTGPEVLERAGEERYLKLVVFVPAGHEETVRNAMSGAGAGHIGNYSHCTFQTPGTGTFLPLEGSAPFLGAQGTLERVQELRLETILPQSLTEPVVQAMLAAHPYEEVAYDLYPLANPGRGRGHGRIGSLSAPERLGALAERLKAALSLPGVRVVGPQDRAVSRVAVSAGAGAFLIGAAARQGAELLVTGDVKYHEAQEALDLGLSLIDVGHFGSESLVVPPLADHLRRRLAERGLRAEVLESRAARDPFLYL